jgi:hypothetical protein
MIFIGKKYDRQEINEISMLELHDLDLIFVPTTLKTNFINANMAGNGGTARR